jgi:serine-type D-Ala-D-Ala carboxypeptidase (penicillin-binding protein 5/6)
MKPSHRFVAKTAGQAPVLPWPSQGQSALVVLGAGTAGVHGQRGSIPIGSVAKVATSLVVLHDHPLTGNAPGPTLTVSAADEREYAAALGTGDSMVPVVAGERITERQALEALMIPSADNIADLLARWDAGSTTAFVAKMNRLAVQLGARQTHYADASGLSSATTSTAADQIRLGERALKEPALAAIMGERSTSLPVAGRVSNYNGLLGSDGVVGIKTGSTTAAGGNLLFAAKTQVGGHPVTVVGAVFGQAVGRPPLSALNVALDSSRVLLRSAVAALRPEVVVRAGQSVSAGVTAWGGSATARTMAGITVLAFPGQALRVSAAGCQLSAPVASGAPCGRMVVAWGDELSGLSSAVTGVRVDRGVAEPTLSWRLFR